MLGLSLQSQGLLDQALTAALVSAQQIDDAYHRALTLAELAPNLSGENRNYASRQALAAAYEIRQTCRRAQALVRMIPILTGSERERVLQEVLVLAHTTADIWLEPQTLAELLPHLSESQREEFIAVGLAAIRAIHNSGKQARLLSEFLPCLPDPLKRAVALEVWMATRRVISERESGRWTRQQWRSLLVKLVPNLSGSLLREALWTALWNIPDEEDRMYVLAGLVPHLPDPLLPDVVEVVQQIRDPGAQVQTVTRLAARLPGPKREWALQGALTTILGIQDQSWWAESLEDLAPYLSESLAMEAATATKAMDGESERARVLAALTWHLPESSVQETLDTARMMRDPGSRAWLLAHLSSRLPNRSKPRVWLKAGLAICEACLQYWLHSRKS